MLLIIFICTYVRPNSNCDTCSAFNAVKESRADTTAQFDWMIAEKVSDSQAIFLASKKKTMYQQHAR